MSQSCSEPGRVGRVSSGLARRNDHEAYVTQENIMSKSDQEPTLHGSSTGHVLSSSAWLDNHFLAMQPEYEEMLRWVTPIIYFRRTAMTETNLHGVRIKPALGEIRSRVSSPSEIGA